MALPLDKLGTTSGPTTVVDLERPRAHATTHLSAVVGAAAPATISSFEATTQGAVVVEHGLAEVV